MRRLAVRDSDGIGPGGQHRVGRISEARPGAAALERPGVNDVVQEHVVRIAGVLRQLMVRGCRVVRFDELACVGISQYELVEVREWKGVDHYVALGPRRVQATRGIGIALDAQQVAGAADITQRGEFTGFVPQRDRPLLNHEHMRLVRLALPQQIFVRLVEPDTPPAASSRRSASSMA